MMPTVLMFEETDGAGKMVCMWGYVVVIVVISAC